MLKRFVAVVSRRLIASYLVGVEFEFRPHFHAPRLGAFPALASAGAYQVALELCQPAHHCQHKPPVRGRGVGPCVAKGPEARFLRGNRRKRVQEVAG
jgi:hypothetical protein